jgi:FHA domain
MGEQRTEIPAGVRRSPVTAFPASRTTHTTQICGRCMAGNSSGETFCKVCGDDLPPPAAVSAPGDVATRRIAQTSVTGQLQIHEDGVGSVGGIFALDKDVVLVGRSSPLDRVFPEIDLTAADPDSYVSRRHAFIVRRHGGFAIEDLDSANGTYVNGSSRLTAHVLAALKDGDQLLFGQTRCTFKARSPKS